MKTFDINNDNLDYNFDYNPGETEFLKTNIKNKKDINIEDLRRISLWKLNRVLEVSEEVISNLQKIATAENITIETSLVTETIKNLTKSSGIGFPMASSILKFLRPDIFPIIDVRAYRALYGKKIGSSQYSIERYIDYVKKINEIAEKKGIELKKVDEQLYCFDKKHNGKI